MIEVTIIETGDTAECDTPEQALCAARTMGWDAKRHARTQGYDPHITFTVDGQIIRSMTLRAINRDPA